MSLLNPLIEHDRRAYLANTHGTDLQAEALKRLALVPELNSILPYFSIGNAVDIERAFEGWYALRDFQRVQVVALLLARITGEEYKESHTQTVRKFGISETEWEDVVKRWKGFFEVLNLISEAKMYSEMSRVHGATTHAAVTGDYRDRRLFYELNGKLKGDKDTQGGKTTIVFINDNLLRPHVELLGNRVASRAEDAPLKLLSNREASESLEVTSVDIEL